MLDLLAITFDLVESGLKSFSMVFPSATYRETFLIPLFFPLVDNVASDIPVVPRGSTSTVPEPTPVPEPIFIILLSPMGTLGFFSKQFFLLLYLLLS